MTLSRAEGRGSARGVGGLRFDGVVDGVAGFAGGDLAADMARPSRPMGRHSVRSICAVHVARFENAASEVEVVLCRWDARSAA